MEQLKIGRLVLGMFQTNCFFLYRDGKQDVIVVDPADQGKYIYESLTQKGFKIAGILLTHGHFDHILGCSDLRKLSGAKVYALEAEKAICEDSRNNLSAQMGENACTIKPNIYVVDGDEITIGDMTCKVIATPGHTVGGCCYYFKEAGFLIGGDTLFEGSVGRTDFPTGDHKTLIRSIKEKLMVLPEEVKVYSGHGNVTTIGAEKRNNPFL